MAGLQHCCRKLFICNTSRLISKNGTLLQPSRSRHHLVFRISSQRNGRFFQNTKLLFNTDKQQLIFRLASTNVHTPKEAVSDSPKIETSQTKTESVASNSEAGVVQNSNPNVVIDESALPAAPTTVGDEVPVMEFVSTGLKEPSFESLGLGGWWPSGMVQQIFEFLHVNVELPWWQAIVAVTLVTRMLLFPVNLSVRRDTIHLTNCIPQISKFQEKITAARLSGDYYATATATQEMQKFMVDNKVNLFSFLKTALIQGPVFLSMYYALKGMAKVPVESLKTGGLFWFTDLTSPDPYYILPILLSGTLSVIIETGAEGNPAKASGHMVKWILRGFPVLVFFISMSFSSCITFYWTVSNFIVLCQVALFRIPAVATFFKLPKRIKYDPETLKKSDKGFIEGFKEGFQNAQITSRIEDRERLNLMKFQKAGTGAIPRTFKRNPLLEKENK